MGLFKKKEKKITTYEEGKEVQSEKVPELKVPVPPQTEQSQPEPAPEEADYFESAREHGFVEGLSFAISTLRQAQNDIIRRQRGQ
jgi:hypothetical protein